MDNFQIISMLKNNRRTIISKSILVSRIIIIKLSHDNFAYVSLFLFICIIDPENKLIFRKNVIDNIANELFHPFGEFLKRNYLPFIRVQKLHAFLFSSYFYLSFFFFFQYFYFWRLYYIPRGRNVKHSMRDIKDDEHVCCVMQSLQRYSEII